MSFTIAKKGALISSTETNDNFQFIADGNLLPRTGDSLAANDATNDLGTSVFTWQDIHVQNIDVQGSITSTWKMIAETTLSALASKVEFTGLSGDTDEIYNIQIKGVKSTAGTYTGRIHFNGDTANSYGLQFIRANGGAVDSARSITRNGIDIIINRGSSTSQGEAWIYAKSGNERTVLNTYNDAGILTSILSIKVEGNIWNNTTDEMTTMAIQTTAGSMGTGTNIQIWAKR